jgi:hypothetical protein
LNKAAIVIIAATMLMAPLGAFAQLNQPGISRLDIIDANYSGPVFLDAFWTDRTTAPPAGTSLEKIEVAPGDGASVLAVTLVNRGFSEITAVTGFLSLPGGFKAAGTGTGQAVATYNNIVPAGGAFTLFFQVDITDKASIREYTAPLKIEFSRTLEVGTPRTADLSAPFKVTGKVILDASSTGGVTPGTSAKVPIEITNTGSAPATGVIATVPGSSGINPATQQASIISLGQKTFELGAIPPGGSVTINPTIYASNASGETLQAVSLQIGYGNAYGVRKNATVPVGLVVLPDTASSLLNVTPAGESSSIIAAGKITDLNVNLVNNDSRHLENVIVSVSSQSDSIKILGNTSWTVGNVAANSSTELSTKVFASKDMIGKATTFTYTVQHLSAGQPGVETFNLGTYVDGEIKVRAYDLGVTYIGGVPNLSGNLLNEGNTIALFTTIELVSGDGLVSKLPPQQYLGDLTENSPLPFSIPIDIADNATAGTYPIELKVEYKDSLKQLQTFEVKSDVAFAPEAKPAEGAQQGQAMSPAMIGIIIGVIAAIIIAIVVIRRRSKSKLHRTIQFSKQGSNNNGGDIESMLDSQLKKPEERK